MLYGEKMKEICDNLGIEKNNLPDSLYSTLLEKICECTHDGTGTTLKDVIDVTGCVAFPYSTASSFNDVLTEEVTENLVSAYRMFEGCVNLVNAPAMHTSGLINTMYMFYNCTSLVNVPVYDFSSVPDTSGQEMFYNCTSLKSMLIRGICFNLDLSASTAFEVSDLVTIINNLGEATSKTLTLGPTNLAKLTAEDIAVATNKGWVVV